MITKKHSGFTVLEFLIVLAVIIILMAIALTGLGRSREKAEDEKRVSELRTISLGIEEFHQACGTYPQSLNPAEPCEMLSDQGKRLNDFIPELQKYYTDPNLRYAPLTYTSTSEDCTGYHIGVLLKNITNPIKTGDQNYDSTSNNEYQCGSASGSYPPFDGNQAGLFDMHR
jgi:type II secretory pathway pseudopilin PulG